MKKCFLAALAALFLICFTALAATAADIPEHEHIPSNNKVISDIVQGTCASPISSYKETTVCEICGAELETKTVEVRIEPVHTPGKAVQENVVKATCKETGSYDSVIYCEVCGTELSRTRAIEPKSDYHIPEEALTRTIIQKEDGYYVTFEDKTCPDIKKDSLDLSALVGKTFAPGKYYLGEGNTRTCADGDSHCAFCGMVLESAIPHVLDKGSWVTIEEYPWYSQKVYRCLICGAEKREPVGGCFGGKYFPYGDVDGDYEVTASDARLALRASVQLEEYDPASRDFYCADYDGDGKLTAEDARSILQTAVNMKSLRWVGYTPYYDPEPGDVDGDGAVTSADARIVLRFCVGFGPLDKIIMGDDQLRVADFDGNGIVESADARLILRWAVGLKTD